MLSPQDYYGRASHYMGEGRPEQAAQLCEQALEQHPRDARILCLAGRSLIALKRFDEAREYLERARTLHVANAMVHETYGDLMLVEGRPGEAVKNYRQAGRLDVSREGLQAKIDRARVAMNRNRPQESTRQATVAFPEEMAKAGRFERDGEPARAEEIYRNILRKDPTHVEAMRLLAAVAVKHRKYSDAEVFLRQALKVAPDYPRAWLDLAAAQMEQEKLEEAIASSEQLVALTPDIAESHISLANAQARADRAEAAVRSYQAALELNPRHAGAFSGLGQQLKTVGRSEEAIAAHRQNIGFNPRNAEPYWSLANMKTFRFSDSEMDAMVQLLQDDDLDGLATVQLHNALGLAYEGRKDYDRAFAHFYRGNELRRESEVYDPVETEVTTSRFIEVFDEALLKRAEGHGLDDPSPIFIVGLPRSGSTLIEQILASHSKVEGTHELSDLALVARAIPRANPKTERFPDNLPGLKSGAWARIGGEYLQRTQKFRSGAVHFIDKNPNNFVYAGLLRMILPNARIINARRHPMDSCFGSYKQLFASGQPFSYDLTEIGEYYLQYQRLMEHWHTVMPGAVLDVQYEDVVSDLETQVRRLLDYCGLPFEEACLNFHETDRAVKTASSEQVRQPIYSGSVNLWQRYEGHLDELKAVLAPLL